MELKEVKSKFVEIFGDEGRFSVFHSPGRVNLIGEHTDCATRFTITKVA